MGNSLALTYWVQRLEKLSHRILDAPPPDRSSVAVEFPRMTLEELQYVKRRNREYAERVNRLNMLYAEFGDLLLEQPEIAREAGISGATLEKEGPGHRWNGAIHDVVGPTALRFRSPHDCPDQSSTARTIAKLISVATRHLASLEEDRTDSTGKPEDQAILNGTVAPHFVVWKGVRHNCQLGPLEMRALAILIRQPETDVNALMNPRSGVWKQRYSATAEKRNKVSKLLGRINDKMSRADPPLRVRFSFRKRMPLISLEDFTDTPVRVNDK